jgi:AraC-like DNA-binding protein
LETNFSFMRTQAKDKPQAASPASAAPGSQFDWNTVRCRLLWYYKGAPNTQSGTFETVNFIIWHMLRGTVKVEYADRRLRAGTGDWVVMVHTLGRRHQAFTPGSQIESLHLSVKTEPAEWAGPSVHVMRGDGELRAAIASVGRYVTARHPSGLMPAGHVYMSRSFEERIRLQTLVWSFMGALYPRLREAGIHIREPEQYDARVSTSRAFIDNWPDNLPWNREQVGWAAGVSASQLDRIWHEARGQTPFQYWNDRRVRTACNRLENTQAGIKEIAYDLGFAHLPQFSTWFKRHRNISPRDYRQNFIDRFVRATPGNPGRGGEKVDG